MILSTQKCACGCGGFTSIATQTRRLATRGKPNRYILHHIPTNNSSPKSTVDMIGLKFGYLTVIERAPRPIHVNTGGAYWFCRCVCKKRHVVKGCSLRSGLVKSCGCTKNWGIDAAFNKCWNVYRSNAKKRNLIFELTRQRFFQLTQTNCVYCGTKPATKTKATCGSIYLYNGIDRSNNKLGYTAENCVSCCHRCNYAKNQMSREEFLNWIKIVFERCCHHHK